MNIEGKVIVITGAGGGLGRAMAHTLAGQGARLALVDVDEENLTQTQTECQQAGAQRCATARTAGGGAGLALVEHDEESLARARAYSVDLTGERAVEQLFADVAGDFGRVDGLVNNAGVTRDSLLVKVKEGKVVGKMSSADWDRVMTLDLRSVFLCAREAAVAMIEHGSGSGGCIVNISSISRAGNIGQTNYAAAKAGVATMTAAWSQELAQQGIRVAAVAPGFCNTQMVAGMKEEMREKMRQRIPVGRLGNPAEIAQTVQFIFENEFVNGRVIEVDGGMRL
jgi:3-oxoacyl-[acyl-carrier protein] reductase